MSVPWTSADIATAKQLDADGVCVDTIALELGRSRNNVKWKLMWERRSPESKARWKETNARVQREKREAKRIKALQANRPKHAISLPHRETVWHGRCPAFRPSYDERRGRMAHVAD